MFMKDITIKAGTYAMEEFEELKRVYIEWQQQLLLFEDGLVRTSEYPGDEMLLIYAMSAAVREYKRLLKMED